MTTGKKILLVCMVLGTAACGVPKSKHRATLDELKKAQDAAAACATTRADLESRLGIASSERDQERTQRTGVEEKYTATQKELEELRKQKAETEKRLETFRELTRKFQSMVDSGKIKVVTRKGRMIMQLPAGVLFASGKADLAPEGEAAIKEVAAILTQFDDRQFLVAGHTDNVPLPRGGRWKDNWELSAARAVTVTKFLTAQGVKPTNLSAAGYGEFDPIADNTREDGKQMNRRIEIVLQPNVSELPQLPDMK